jgi:hypothetical protein
LEISELLAKATVAQRTVALCYRGDLVARAEQLKAEWQAATAHDLEHNEPPTAPAIWDRLAAVEADAEAATVELTVKALSATEWRRLVADHPPPAGDTEGWVWDNETFQPAALAACAVEPAMSEAQAQELAATLSNAQWSKVFGAVLACNVSDNLVPKFTSVTNGHRPTGLSSTTAVPEGSLTASS